jgi:hemerythrin
MNNDIIEWDNRYTVGIEKIDAQHRELLKMANDLCLGCREERASIHNVVSFLRYHFLAEEEILENIRYPDIRAHTQQHYNSIREISDRLDRPAAARQPIPKNLPYQLRNRIIAHIALIDKKYATYIHIINRNAERQIMEQSPPTELFLG